MADPTPVDVRTGVAEALELMLPVLAADELPTTVLGHSFGALLAAEFAAAVDRAEKYVSIEVYIQSWDEVTDVFFQALARATAPPPRGRSRNSRGEPSERIATMVSDVRPRPIVSPCQATESRPSR